MTVTARTLALAARPDGKPKPVRFPDADRDPARAWHRVRCCCKRCGCRLTPICAGRMSDGPSYAAATEIGQPLPSEVVARVLTSADPALAPGDIVVGP